MMILLTKALRADAYARLLVRRTDGTPKAMAAEDARFGDLVARCTGPAALEVIRSDDAAVRAKVRGDFGVEYASEGGYAAQVIDFHGLQVVIENPVGSVRAGIDPDGKAWSTELTADYGYISGTEGADGDMVDVFIGPDKACTTAYVARCQVAGKWHQFDEDKVLLGFPSEDAAREAFQANYNDPRFLGGMDTMSMDTLKERLKKPGRLVKAAPRVLILFAKAHVGPYLQNYNDPRFLGGIDAMTVDMLKDRLKKPGRLAKALVLFSKSHISAYTKKDGTFVSEHDDKRQSHASLPTDDPTAVAKQSLSVESAAYVRADRIVAGKTNPADKARERGFRDAMMGTPSRRHEFSKISQVSYDQGVDRAKKTREALKGRPWMETELERDGSKWRWAVYEEGRHIASGEAKTEKAAGQAVDDARVRAAEKRATAAGITKSLLIFTKAHVGPYLRNGRLVNLAGYQGRNAAVRAAAAGQAALFSDEEAPKPKRKKASPERFDHTKTADLFADTDTAHAEGDKWVMPIKDAIAEHAELVAALKSPGKADDQREVKEQAGELGRMKSTVEQGGAEAALRAFWDEKGVPKDQQDALIAAVAEKAAPGAQVGPFRVPDRPWLIFDQKNKSANEQKGLTSALSGSKIETSGAVPGTARRESGAQEKKMSIPEVKLITYTLPEGTAGQLAGKTLTGGRASSRVIDGKSVEVVIFPTEENGFDAGKYGPEIVVKTPGRPDLIAAVADQKAAKAAAFEAAIPGILEILPLSRKVGNDRARYAEQFSRMMEDEGNDGARPPKLTDEAREKLLEEKLAANPRAAQYLRALSFEGASNYMKAAAGSKAKAMLLAGEPTDKAQAEMDDWTGEKAKAAEAAASGARLRSIMTRENGWDVVENMPEFFSPEWKALQGKGYKMYMLGRDGVPVENALNGTIMAKPL